MQEKIRGWDNKTSRNNPALPISSKCDHPPTHPNELQSLQLRCEAFELFFFTLDMNNTRTLGACQNTQRDLIGTN